MLALLGRNIGVVGTRCQCRQDVVLVHILAVRMRCWCWGAVLVLSEHDIGVVGMQCWHWHCREAVSVSKLWTLATVHGTPHPSHSMHPS